ncbi:MAG TPA: copper resistance protein CopC, partial [Thermomicrobiales bacterium]|nr:copper resistance protein CopC [Thermomicrobiales bacterium]
WLLVTPPAISAHANLERSEPASGAAVPTAPTQIKIWFSEQPEPKYSSITVYDTKRTQYDQGGTQAVAGDPLELTVAVRQLPEGTYTVVWKTTSAVDGHTTSGSFVFAVGTTPPVATSTGGDEVEFTPPSPADVIVKWLLILAATAFTGALGLRPLVWLPVLRRTNRVDATPGGVFDRAVTRRLTLLAGAALLLLFLVTIAGLLLQVAKATGGPFAVSALNDFLFTTRSGGIWLVRLLLPIVAAMFLGPLLLAARRRPDGARQPAEPPTAAFFPMLFGLVLGAGYLLTISLTAHAAASALWPVFSVVLDWLHLLGTAVWIGGLIGLVLTVPLVRELGREFRPVLAGVVARFSTIALISVGVLGVTGLYSAWLHVGSFGALLPTDYGRALTLKLALFAGLMALGAFNLLWLKPALARQHDGKAGTGAAARRAATERVSGVLFRQFTRVIRLEVILGILILVIVGALTNFVPAREAIVQARLPKRSQTVKADDLRVTLTLGSLQPGDTTTYDALVKDKNGHLVTDALRVTFRFDMLDMAMGETEAVATSQGNGHYTATGAYLPMSGHWKIRAIVRRANLDDVEGDFAYTLGSSANLLQQSTTPTPPKLPALNSGRGIGSLALALSAVLLFFGVRLFRRGSGLGTALLMLVPTALVVGGYLFYNAGNQVVINRQAEPPNPVPANAASLSTGGDLFAQNCAVCHGAQGRGDGPEAASLNPRPVNFTLPHTASHSDGYLFNIITDGSPGSAMPSWQGTFNDQQRWDLVNYLRTLNPLTNPELAASGTPTPATPAPGNTPATPSGGATPRAGGPLTGPWAARAPQAGNGHLIYAFDGKLWSLDPAGGDPVNLTPDLPANAYAADPALSPDGTQLAYTLVVVPPVTPGVSPELAGSDLYIMAPDGQGGHGRMVFKHDQPGVLLAHPVWTPDGQAVIFAYSAPTRDASGRLSGSVHELQRLDVATGARTTVLSDGDMPAFAPVQTAQPFAYVYTDPKTFEQAIWVADANGQNAHKVVGFDAGFQTFNQPQFSPDGARLIFSAAGGPGAPQPTRPPGGSLPARFARWLLGPLVPQTAAAHGLPADLWSVALDGSDLRQLT